MQSYIFDFHFLKIRLVHLLNSVHFPCKMNKKRLWYTFILITTEQIINRSIYTHNPGDKHLPLKFKSLFYLKVFIFIKGKQWGLQAIKILTEVFLPKVRIRVRIRVRVSFRVEFSGCFISQVKHFDSWLIDSWLMTHLRWLKPVLTLSRELVIISTS